MTLKVFKYLSDIPVDTKLAWILLYMLLYMCIYVIHPTETPAVSWLCGWMIFTVLASFPSRNSDSLGGFKLKRAIEITGNLNLVP